MSAWLNSVKVMDRLSRSRPKSSFLLCGVPLSASNLLDSSGSACFLSGQRDFRLGGSQITRRTAWRYQAYYAHNKWEARCNLIHIITHLAALVNTRNQCEHDGSSCRGLLLVFACRLHVLDGASKGVSVSAHVHVRIALSLRDTFVAQLLG